MDGSIGEALVSATLAEALPGHPFVKTRAEPWLEGLELDCYNAELRLAFEYQGQQHYDYVPFFHDGGPEDFAARLRRDELKRTRTCDEFVALVEVPYTIPRARVRDHVRRELQLLSYDIAPAVVPLDEFMVAALADGRLTATMLAKARATAESHGGRCLSEGYVDCHTPLSFVCAKGHEFDTPLASVNAADHPRPRFCPECGGTRRRTFEENAALVAPSGYVLLDVTSIRTGNNRTQLHLRCPAGHAFVALRSNFLPVIDGVPHRGCIRCARLRTNREKGRIAREQRLVEFGLIALDPYGGRHLKARWRCVAGGHEFTACWNTINDRQIHKRPACLLCPR